MANGGNGPAIVQRSPASTSTPLSTTALVNSSMNNGTPSVRSMICSVTSPGRALPPFTQEIIAARSGGRSRLRLSNVTCAADPPRRELRAKRHDHQDGERRYSVDDQVKQIARTRIAPMQI